MKKLLTTLTLLTLLSATAYSQRPMRDCNGTGQGYGNRMMNNEHNGMRGQGQGYGQKDGFGPYMIEYLELDEKQIEKIHDIRTDFNKKGIDLKAGQQKLRIDKQEAMRDMDFKKAKKITEEMSDLRTKMQIMRIDQKEEISNILSKDQLKKFRDHPRGAGQMNNGMMKNKTGIRKN